MTVHWIDWTIILGFLVLLTGAALATRRYSRSVADFMVANRCAKRYLLTTAHAMSILGAVSIIQEFQIKYEAGFVSQWWGYMLIPIGLFVSLSGWVVYRWRATRILTQAQLFEMRYNKPYRIFVGILAFAGGVWGLGDLPRGGGQILHRLSGSSRRGACAGGDGIDLPGDHDRPDRDRPGVHVYRGADHGHRHRLHAGDFHHGRVHGVVRVRDVHL